jgi:hypothetical protein
MNQFEYCGSLFNAFDFIGDGLGRGDSQYGPNPLTTREQTVAHGTMDRVGLCTLCWNAPLQSSIDDHNLLSQVF